MTAAQAPVFRFAPSPNGYLHLGHAYSALFNLRLAHSCGGRLLLRIEDIDPARSRRHFEAALIEDLDWLGFRFDGAPLRQSEHLADYRSALDELAARDLVYPCFCSRAEIARVCCVDADCPRDPDGAFLYPGTCRSLTESQQSSRLQAGGRPCLRLDMAKALAERPEILTYQEFYEGGIGSVVVARPQIWGDVMIARRDVAASYHLACTLDDHAQDVTDVVRGVDLEAATGLHRLLQALLGLRTPDYRHHRLVLDVDGRKLSKSKSSPSIRDLRRRGVSAAEIRAGLSQRMGVDF